MNLLLALVCFIVGLVGLALGFFFRELRNMLHLNGSQEKSKVVTGSDEQWKLLNK
jgi:hypothetical protein